MNVTDQERDLEEEIRQATQKLQTARKQAMLLELQAQVAEEEKKIQAFRERLVEAQQTVGPDTSGESRRQSSIGLESPVTAVSPAFSAALEDLIHNCRDLSEERTTATDRNLVENNNRFTSGSMPVTCERGRAEADTPAVQRPYLPAPEPASQAPRPAQVDHGHIGGQPLGERVWVDDAAARHSPSSCSLHNLPPEQVGDRTNMKKVFSGTGLTFERTEDGNSPQPQLTRARQSSATPPKSAGLQLSPYKGSEWNEFVHYMNILAVHFAQHPDYYTEARRVELGKQYISSELRGKLQSQIIDPESLTWLSFCTLLRQQLPQTGHEVERMQNARQKTAQCVTHFALWLSSLFTLGYNDRDVREILLKGALPEIISGLQRPPTPPRDYNTLVQELQEIENAIPWRARVLPSHKTMTVSNGDGQEVPVYFATEWKEYKQFRACLERYAERCRRPHDEAFMIAVGRKHLARAFLTRWDDHANRLQEVNWFAFCVFLVEQIPSQSPGRNYWKRSQRQNQPVDLFALELLRWAPGDLDVAHDRRKHLSDRVLKELHLEANRSLGIFDEFHMFVAHLRAYQDSLSVQQRPKRRRLA